MLVLRGNGKAIGVPVGATVFLSTDKQGGITLTRRASSGRVDFAISTFERASMLEFGASRSAIRGNIVF